MTQNERLLGHLQDGHSIDPLAALQTLGIYRLGARVYDLKQDGHKIERQLVEVKNRFGDTCRVARYSLTRQ